MQLVKLYLFEKEKGEKNIVITFLQDEWFYGLDVNCQLLYTNLLFCNSLRSLQTPQIKIQCQILNGVEAMNNKCNMVELLKFIKLIDNNMKRYIIIFKETVPICTCCITILITTKR